MLKFFQEVWGLLETVFQFLVSFIESLLSALYFLMNSATFNVLIVGVVPTIIGTCVTIVIAVSIVKFLLGR